ncbi:tetratricopeptide repeat protein [Granulicella cerasi]|uniref:Tetratricopeptide repeat protein n=1 Tax=Granulicella cerasi TaxID=741063 RepID=A0ABW1ZCA0_9BACT|nr:hypothetical protein [Granulicella cerasi]
MRVLLSAIVFTSFIAANAQNVQPPALVSAREALTARNPALAKTRYEEFAKAHPTDARAPQGMGDAELMMHQYEAAELDYRRAVMIDPNLWPAHKSLVLVEAKLGRWDDFESERKLLHDARVRGADNISAKESDLIDSFEVAGKPWLVREYFVPMGRSEARYNFEHFTPEGKASEYISLERADAAKTALERAPQVVIGKDDIPAAPGEFALNWYTGSGHGTIRHYKQEPSYRTLRADTMRWLRARAAHK